TPTVPQFPPSWERPNCRTSSQIASKTSPRSISIQLSHSRISDGNCCNPLASKIPTRFRSKLRLRPMMSSSKSLSGYAALLRGLCSSRTTTSGLESIWICAAFSASCGCRGACAERVQNRPDLYMRPCSSSRCAHFALVELGGNGVVARCPVWHDLVDDGGDVGCKPPCICL